MKDLSTYWCYWNNYGTVQVRSIGHKWVWLRQGSTGQFKKIRRAAWDSITKHESFMTLDECNHRLMIRKQANELGIDQIKTTKVLMSHPTRKFGWEYKTFEELESEVNTKIKEVA